MYTIFNINQPKRMLKEQQLKNKAANQKVVYEASGVTDNSKDCCDETIKIEHQPSSAI
jgi:hypothetical protein